MTGLGSRDRLCDRALVPYGAVVAVLLFSHTFGSAAYASSDGNRRAEIGVACYEAHDFDCALRELVAADSAGDLGTRGLWALARTYEAAGDSDKAFATYSRYPEAGYFSGERRRMTRRVRDLLRTRAELIDIASVREIDDRAIAILPLRTTTARHDLAPLGLGLTEWLMTDLFRVRALNVLERVRTAAIAAELSFGGRDGVDPASAPRVGRSLGARRIVGGSVLDLGNERMRIDLFVLDVRSEGREVSVTREGPLHSFFAIEKEIVFALLDELQIELSPREREEIERVPTRSLAAFLAHARGLALEDEGDDGRADEGFQRAEHEGQGALDRPPEPLFDAPLDPIHSLLDATLDRVSGDSWPDEGFEGRPDPPEARREIPAPPPPPPPPPPGRAPATLGGGTAR